MTDGFWRPNAPLHIKESCYSPWESWFAWYPVSTQQDERVWLKRVWRRLVYRPAWVSIEAEPYFQYSLIKKGYWER